MSSNDRARKGIVLGVAAAVVAGGLSLHAADAYARTKKQAARQLASIIRQEAPLGLRRHNAAVIVPFMLQNNKRKYAVVDVEYGWDRNGDGIIADGTVDGLPSEYSPCTHNRRDTRDTSAPGRKLRYRAGVPPGTAHAFSWNADADLPGVYLESQGLYVTAGDGRLVQDPNSPEDFLRQSGETGVKLRLRTQSGSGRRKVKSAWSYTAAFSVNNNEAPSARFDMVVGGDQVIVDWVGFDADSEDTNGDGLFDLLGGEDRDQDGVFDQSFMSVAFDYSILAEGEDPTGATDAQLAQRVWLPCTPDEGVGDPVSGLTTTPDGTSHVFAWDWKKDPTVPGAQVLLRFRGFDGFEHTGMVYDRTPVTLDQ